MEEKETTLTSREKREFLRIKVCLPLEYDILSPDDLQEVKKEILSGEAISDDSEIEASRFWHGADLSDKMDEQFSQITQFLKQVDAKLDYLIALSEGGQPVKKAAHSVSLLDISGAGLAFVDRNAIPADTYLKVRIRLNRFPLVEVAALSQVVRSLPLNEDSEQGRFEVGILFIAMHKDSRERVFHFISRVERKMLRDRKEAMNP